MAVLRSKQQRQSDGIHTPSELSIVLLFTVSSAWPRFKTFAIVPSSLSFDDFSLSRFFPGVCVSSTDAFAAIALLYFCDRVFECQRFFTSLSERPGITIKSGWKSKNKYQENHQIIIDQTSITSPTRGNFAPLISEYCLHPNDIVVFHCSPLTFLYIRF